MVLGPDDGDGLGRCEKSIISYSSIQAIRLVCIFILAGFWYEKDGPLLQFKYYTVWNSYFSFFSLVLNYFATEQQWLYPEKIVGWKLTVWHFAHVLTVLAVSLDLLITIGF